MSLSEDLAWRGLIKDKTFGDIKWLDEPKKFYLGIDASSDSLTIGNLAVIMLARRLLDAGWGAVLLAGGATSLVGDPGGKDEERELKAKDEIAKNIEGIRGQIEKLFAGQPHELVNNLDWLGGLNYLDFLRDFGKLYPVSELIQREFVDTRISDGGSGISYAEFSYSLLQGYDFWWLFKNKEVTMQIGASDQWGNMLSGVELVRKKEAKEAQALSMPLVVNKATGKKFGKSEEGTIWLDTKKTPYSEFRQFWINVDDADVEDYLKIFTLLSKERIDDIMTHHRKNPGLRIAQNELSSEVAEIVHPELTIVTQNQEATANIRVASFDDVAEVLSGKIPLDQVEGKLLQQLRHDIPVFKYRPELSIVDALVETGLAKSRTLARIVIANNGVYINGRTAHRQNFRDDDFMNGRLLLRRGKAYKDSALVELA